MNMEILGLACVEILGSVTRKDNHIMYLNAGVPELRSSCKGYEVVRRKCQAKMPIQHLDRIGAGGI